MKGVPVTVCGNSAVVVVGGRVPPDRYGDCGKPADKPRMIRIRGSLRGEKFTEVLVHELLHLAGWHLDECFIEQAAKDLAAIILHPDFDERIFGGE